jgi:photosystem II stability/assembly factor-like uncharacterized protein
LDGTKVIAVANSNGDPAQNYAWVVGGVYTSTDSGVTWTNRRQDNNFCSCASSADGVKVVVGACGNTGRIYTSTDSGATWTERAQVLSWISLSSSHDGNTLVAVQEMGNIWVSTDSGVTWTSRGTPAANQFGVWRPRTNSVSISSDGKIIGIAAYDAPIFVSNDTGLTWVRRESHRYWYAFTMSRDGASMLAGVGNGRVYSSLDGGASWTQQNLPSSVWETFAITPDNSRWFAGECTGKIYTA